MAARKGSQKPTAAELEMRVNEVFSMLVIGATKAHIFRYASETWGVTRRTTDSYVTRATDRLKELAKVDREAEVSKAMKRYEMIFQKALKAGQYYAAINAQKELCKLLALNKSAQVQVEHTGTVEHEHVAIEQRVQRINEILEAARTRRIEPPPN